jgi:hypothetical protein
MKRSLIFIIFLSLFYNSSGNIAPPQAFISEIYWDNNMNWTLEIGFWEWYAWEIDSMIVETSSGTAMILDFELLPGNGFPNFDSIAVLTSDNLSNPLTINRPGDFVKITSYSWGVRTDMVTFGNYPGSFLDTICNGESISYIYYISSPGYVATFCTDKSPTIGMGNDTTGVMADFTGKAYQPSGDEFTSGYFYFCVGNLRADIQSDGSFSSRVPSRRYEMDDIMYYSPKMHYMVDPQFSFFVKPDSTIDHDIHTDFFISLEEKDEKEPVRVITYPNPFTTSIKFCLELTQSTYYQDMVFVIHDNAGKHIIEKAIEPKEIEFTWTPPDELKPGIYYYSLYSRNELIKSGKVIKR